MTPEMRRVLVEGVAELGAPLTGIEFQSIGLRGIPAARFPPTTQSATGPIVYVHGGAFVAGSSRSHRYICSALARRTGAPVYSIDYRLAPEHPYPAAIDDVTEAIRALGESTVGSGIVLAGDSAGGTIALLAAQRLKRDSGHRIAGIALVSPIADLRCTSATYEQFGAADPFISRQRLKADISQFLRNADPSDPDVSPALADLSALPPIFIQVGSEEVLLGDTLALERAANKASVPVTVKIWPGMIHVWHAFPKYLEDSDRALEEMARFLREALK